MAVDKNGKQLPKGITLRNDGRYMGRFTYQGETYTLYDRDLKTLKKKLNDLQYEVEHGVFAKEENITIESWFNTWINEYKMNSVKQGTIVSYKDCFNYYILPTLGKKKLKDLRPEQIQKLYNELVKKEYSKATIELVSIIINSMYKQAYKNGIVQKNPVEMTTLPREKKKIERRVLSLNEQNLFLQYAEGSRNYNLYKVALFTGMRSGELRALEWDNIGFKNDLIYVKGTLKHFAEKGHVKDTPKTMTSEREIPMLDGIVQILKNQRIEQKKLKLALGDMWQPNIGLENLVFTSETGKPVTSTSLFRNINKIINLINKDEKTKTEWHLK